MNFRLFLAERLKSIFVVFLIYFALSPLIGSIVFLVLYSLWNGSIGKIVSGDSWSMSMMLKTFPMLALAAFVFSFYIVIAVWKALLFSSSVVAIVVVLIRSRLIRRLSAVLAGAASIPVGIDIEPSTTFVFLTISGGFTAWVNLMITESVLKGRNRVSAKPIPPAIMTDK